MRQNVAPEMGEKQTILVENKRSRSAKWNMIGAFSLTLAGMGAYRYLFDREHPEPVQTIGVIEPVKLRKWQPAINQCFGGAPMRVTARISRENTVPLWGLPDIPLADDTYTIAATLDYDMCLPGMAELGNNSPIEILSINEGTPEETIEVHIYQSRGALIMNRPRVNHTLCNAEESRSENNDCYIDYGQDSGTTDFIEALPFTEDTDNVRNRLLNYLQIQGANPQCLEEGFEKIAFATLLLSSIESQAEESAFDPRRITVFLYDINDKLTDSWDSSEQNKIFIAESEEFTVLLPENNVIDFSVECDVSDFGIATATESVVEDK